MYKMFRLPYLVRRYISVQPLSATNFRVTVPYVTQPRDRKHLLHQRFFERVVYPLQCYSQQTSPIQLESSFFDGNKHEYTFVVKQPEHLGDTLQQFEHIIQEIKSTMKP